MSDKSGKPKKAKKSSAGQPSVLGSLPATRPDRLGRRSDATATKAAPARGARTTAAKPKPTRAAAKPAAAKPAKAAKPKATRSTAASRAASTEKAAAAQRRSARPAPPPPPPQDEPRRISGPPKGPELVTTAFQAAGEIAHIGITVGGQVLKRAARRIPRP